MTITRTTYKKYGKPYERKNLLHHGDIKKISVALGISYGNVNQQLGGYRKIHPVVMAMADKFANESQALIDSINNTNQ